MLHRESRSAHDKPVEVRPSLLHVQRGSARLVGTVLFPRDGESGLTNRDLTPHAQNGLVRVATGMPVPASPKPGGSPCQPERACAKTGTNRGNGALATLPVCACGSDASGLQRG